MGDEIRQPGNIGRVLPLNPARDPGPRKRPRPRPDPAAQRKRERRPADDRGQQVDEYV